VRGECASYAYLAYGARGAQCTPTGSRQPAMTLSPHTAHRIFSRIPTHPPRVSRHIPPRPADSPHSGTHRPGDPTALGCRAGPPPRHQPRKRCSMPDVSVEAGWPTPDTACIYRRRPAGPLVPYGTRWLTPAVALLLADGVDGCGQRETCPPAPGPLRAPPPPIFGPVHAKPPSHGSRELPWSRWDIWSYAVMRRHSATPAAPDTVTAHVRGSDQGSRS
jgi:hypothetical protein